MNVAASTRQHETALEELRLALHDMLGSHRRLRSRDSRVAGAVGFAHHRLLWELRQQGPLTASHLAQAADLAPATASEMIDALVTAGLVERHRDTDDRRIVRISLTPLGRRQFDATRARLARAWSRELSDLDREALEGATLVLERLTQYFDRL